ncbi:hypothetical protein LZ30DRAFT_32219 [Colletotrichum cereale]|nr:hypothetical protein LZ30DRAFT_32219 [Colletotrichum cereale]
MRASWRCFRSLSCGLFSFFSLTCSRSQKKMMPRICQLPHTHTHTHTLLDCSYAVVWILPMDYLSRARWAERGEGEGESEGAGGVGGGVAKDCGRWGASINLCIPKRPLFSWPWFRCQKRSVSLVLGGTSHLRYPPRGM